MTLESLTRSLEEKDARITALTRALRDLHAATATVLSPDSALELAKLEATLALALQPAPTRDEMCQRSAWCVARDGHRGECERVDGRPAQVSDFGPGAAKRRRY